MIQANELRVGNLVYELFRETKNVIDFDFSVYEHHDINGKTYWDDSLKVDILKELEPIPLTEEWLLKFGFEYEETEDHSYYFKNEVGLFFHAGFWNFYSFYTLIKYVHQLQNIYFALTGEELKLNEI